MKHCPACQRTYPDSSLNFCRVDGTRLTETSEDAPTQIIAPTGPTSGNAVITKVLPGSSANFPQPVTKYAKSGDINIAYQVVGDGPIDLVFVPGWVSHVEYLWEEPVVAQFFQRLASCSRLILFDKRGTGLSDQTTDLPTLEQRMDDVRAVMEAAGSERAVVFGFSEGGNMCLLFAATYPERTIALITFGVFAKRVWDPEYPWAPTPEQRQKFYDALEHGWGGPVGIEDIAPSMAGDTRFRKWWATYQRRSVSPRAALALARMNTLIDVRQVLPSIRVPTLVMHRVGDRDANVEEGRYIASRIPGARYVELSGEDHLIFAGNQADIIAEVETFLQNVALTSQSDTVLSTILVARYDKLNGGDEQRIEKFRAAAKRETEWFKGRVSRETDCFLATFDGPARAIRAARAIVDAATSLDLSVQSGLHMGLCNLSDNMVTGLAADATRKLAAQAAPGEILVSGAVVDLISGSGIEFEKKEVAGELEAVYSVMRDRPSAAA